MYVAGTDYDDGRFYYGTMWFDVATRFTSAGSAVLTCSNAGRAVYALKVKIVGVPLTNLVTSSS